MSNPMMPEQESLRDIKQHLRFNVLVPFYVEMEHKRQEDVTLGYMQDASKIYGKTIDELMQLIEAHTAQAVREAEKRVIDDLIIAQGSYPSDRSYVINGDSFFCVPTSEVENYQEQLTQEMSN